MMTPKLIILIITLTFANTENIYFSGCDDPSKTTDDKCSIHEISMNPCSTSTVVGLCNVVKPSQVILNVEYTQYFGGNIHGNIYRITDDVDVPILLPFEVCTMGRIGPICHHEYGVKVNSTINWAISSHLPDGESRFKIKMWNIHRFECCAVFNLNILETTSDHC